MDDDDETTYETVMFLYFDLNTPLFVFIAERDKDSITPWLW